MIKILYIFFFTGPSLIFYSYAVYPLILKIFSFFCKSKALPKLNLEYFPEVSIVMAAYNEEKVIEKKILSVLETDYPKDKLEFLIGSDHSTDSTDEIIRRFAEKHPFIQLIRFPGRTGKAPIINELKKNARGRILISTDANVIFSRMLIKELVRYFNEPRVGMAAAHIIRSNDHLKGIQSVEKTYIQRENRIKERQSCLSGILLGVEGGCFAIRKELFPDVPKGFFMDDFFITMHVIRKNFNVIFSPKALCYEDIPEHSSEEFKRKTRISIGNYQNMAYYKNMLFNPFHRIFFHFISHKFLRWITPFLFILSTLAAGGLAIYNDKFWLVFGCMAGLLLLPKMGNWVYRFPGIKYAAHFMNMNYALMKGLILFLNPPDNSIWQPTQRNV